MLYAIGAVTDSIGSSYFYGLVAFSFLLSLYIKALTPFVMSRSPIKAKVRECCQILTLKADAFQFIYWLNLSRS
jgi:hypothetical protein